MGRTCITHERGEKCIPNLSPKTQRKEIFFGRPKHRLDHIEMDLKEIILDDMDWFYLA
jgi:hypothetical protein